ncbi:hypothetical protein LK994_05220 [Ferruginibacter lapsinanis]|uniref:hypothetical protein n=1 Tax=Ferruginibacter lapsinanis TaxID=563172 RepID=UPI001E49D636|nr:hypothetical protein [Ferruginibacter lapsinanis]UEG50874.1 hypothetical protein LK994_05220 [Ferruginibacter lapsinanis]
MIEKLTIGKLKETGFNERQIKNFKTNPQYEAYHYNKSGCFFASNKEKKIYSGSDATLLIFDKSENNIPFPYWDKDLIPVYFERKKQLFIKELKRSTGNIFIEKAANENFKANEIQITKNTVKSLELTASFKINSERAVLLNMYLNWLYDLDSNLKPKPIRIYYAIKLGNIVNNYGSGEIGLRQYTMFFKSLNDFSFQTEIKSLPPEKIPEQLEFHLRNFERNGGEKMDWLSHTRDLLPINITPQQKDSFLSWCEKAEAKQSKISNNNESIISLKNYPKLNSIIDYFNKSTPYSELQKYWKKQYDSEARKDAVSLEEAKKDISRIIGVIKSKFIRREINSDQLFIKELIAEREEQALNIPGTDQREYFKTTYNIKVLSDVEKYFNVILTRLGVIFNPHFQKPDIDKLNIKNLFQFWYKEFSTKEHRSIKTPEQEKDLSNSNDSVNVFCNAMPISVPKEHFAKFTETNSKNNKPFLTNEQLNSFIEKAFYGKTDIKKQTINYGKRERLFIVKRFYEFYLMCSTEYENTTQCQPKYIRLLTDNFINWEFDNIKNNFGNKVKREW